MISKYFKLLFLITVLFTGFSYGQKGNTTSLAEVQTKSGFINAYDHGFSPNASGIENAKALQLAVDHAGTIIMSLIQQV